MKHFSPCFVAQSAPDCAVLKFITHTLRYYRDLNPGNCRLNDNGTSTA